jgi:hypothetical protein
MIKDDMCTCILHLWNWYSLFWVEILRPWYTDMYIHILVWKKGIYYFIKRYILLNKIKGIYFLKNRNIILWLQSSRYCFGEKQYILFIPNWVVCWQYTFQFEFEQYVYSKLCSMLARSIYLSIWIWAVCLFKIVQYVGKKYIPFNLNLSSMFDEG